MSKRKGKQKPPVLAPSEPTMFQDFDEVEDAQETQETYVVAREEAHGAEEVDAADLEDEVVTIDREDLAELDMHSVETEAHSVEPETQTAQSEAHDDAVVGENVGEIALGDREADVEGTELESFESANIEDLEQVSEDQLDSIVESILFASDKPVSLATLRSSFVGTTIKSQDIRASLKRIATELENAKRGVTLEDVPGGYQLRTKIDNFKFLTRSVKTRYFKVSGPALEVLAIVAYKQPTIKSEIDEIRGVESGHLLRALMDKGLVCFEGKSDLPGRPMQYATTKKFLEIFGLRNLRELPTLAQIDEILPDGIGDEETQQSGLSDLTEELSQQVTTTYSEGEEELGTIMGQLQEISTSSEFFEKEKERQRQQREAERAQDIREALLVGEEVSNRDRKWLERYDTALSAGQAFKEDGEAATAQPSVEGAAAIAEGAGAEGETDDLTDTDDGRFETEEDQSLDSDLNVDMHDEEEEKV